MGIFIASRLKDGVYQVHLLYERRSLCMEPAAASQFGLALIKASAIAEAEASIVNAVTNLNAGSPDSDQRQASLLLLLRSQRPKLLKAIRPIFGHNTRSPLVELKTPGFVMTLKSSDASDLGVEILQCAEAAKTDMLMAQVLGGVEEMDDERIAFLMTAISELRNTTQRS